MPLVLTVVALLVFGLIMLYSASFDFSYQGIWLSHVYVHSPGDAGWCWASSIAFVLSLFDYHNWRRIVVFAMLGTIGLLVTVAVHQ